MNDKVMGSLSDLPHLFSETIVGAIQRELSERENEIGRLRGVIEQTATNLQGVVDQLRASLGGEKKPRVRKRKLTAEGRKRISEGVKRRWKKHRQEKAHYKAAEALGAHGHK